MTEPIPADKDIFEPHKRRTLEVLISILDEERKQLYGLMEALERNDIDTSNECEKLYSLLCVQEQKYKATFSRYRELSVILENPPVFEKKA